MVGLEVCMAYARSLVIVFCFGKKRKEKKTLIEFSITRYFNSKIREYNTLFYQEQPSYLYTNLIVPPPQS